MVSITTVLLIVAFCFYIGILYLNPILLTIGYAMGILLAVSVVEVLYRMVTLRCRMEAPISMTESGRPVQVVLRFQNKGVLPVGKVEVKVEHKNVFHNKTKKQWIDIQDVSIGESKHTIKMKFDGAGCHEIMLTHIRIYCLFGLIYLGRKSKDSCSVLIMPEIYATNIQLTEAVRNFLGDADVYDDFRPGHDSGETFEIRKYREKDKLQSIHWKLSAKMDELMVKESSMPKACAVVLMLELKPWKTGKKGRKEMDAGAYLELAASVSYSLMDQMCPHFVAWYSAEREGVRRIRVDDEESFYLFLNVYLREAIPRNKHIREEYRMDYKSEWYLHDLLINEKLELYKNNELITKINEKKIKDDCEKLEILL